MRDAWSLSADRPVAHLRSELIKALFDVDKMMYFVAPEWWQPRRHQSSLQTGVDMAQSSNFQGRHRKDHRRIARSSYRSLISARARASARWAAKTSSDGAAKGALIIT